MIKGQQVWWVGGSTTDGIEAGRVILFDEARVVIQPISGYMPDRVVLPRDLVCERADDAAEELTDLKGLMPRKPSPDETE